ncbi:MAG: hypothetical protein HQM14_07035 [SAR324 cluster bacterium]|nr:hypothetical protein [SAR324 cluster bacterium]
MLDNFDPKEKKAIIIFFALLLLAITYVSTHELPWEQEQVPYPDNQKEIDNLDRRSPPKERSYERFL